MSSELAPFAKVGGLADVSYALPRALAQAGVDVRIVVPLYRRALEHIRSGGISYHPLLDGLSVELGHRKWKFSVVETILPRTKPGVPCYFVVQPDLYDRPGIYTSAPDEHIRFCLLQWAALKICQYLSFSPHIVHANDWQTALLPLMIKTAFAWDQLFSTTKTVLSIHNIGHQGVFPASILHETGLAQVKEHFHQEQLSSGKINFLLTGILYANLIITVSPTYAREIKTPEHGVGLDPFLRARGHAVLGILNGIDEEIWNPATDQWIEQPYDENRIELKEKNKEALCRDFRISYDPKAPLFGIVSRLVWQKGFDLCIQVFPSFLATTNSRLVVLGAGEAKYEQFFRDLAIRFSDRVGFYAGFSEPLAHRIEAGADFFVMPSRYEPCGLNQMYSLRYGTLPVVHRTGGLADTVRLIRSALDPNDQGNGVVLDHFDAGGLSWALKWALQLWGSGDGMDRERFRALQRKAMRERNGWQERVQEYLRAYQMLLQ
ncbi:MAG: glycogen synthase [Sandaracinaceae bacterium]|nr:glycogen synthase [Sandaracinaceae bacterium]